MKKKKVFKKFFHIILAFVLLLCIVGRCSRSGSSSAPADQPVEEPTTYNFVNEEDYLKSFGTTSSCSSLLVAYAADAITASQIAEKTRYCQGFGLKYINAAAAAFTYSTGYALAHPTISGGESYVTVLPAYTLVGKLRLVYSNNDSELITCYANFQGDNNTSSWSPTWDNEYLANVSILPQTLLWTRQHGSTVTSFELSLSSMPYVYNSGASIYYNHTSNSALMTSYPGLLGYGGVTAVDGVSETINLSTGQNYYFRTNTVNSIDRSYSSDPPTNKNLAYGDYSLTTYYCSYCLTNDETLYNNVKTGSQYQINNNKQQELFPIFLMGLKKGIRITRNNVTNYNDYGITFDINNNTYNYDYNTANNYYNTVVTNQFMTEFDNIYTRQPDIGLTFTADNCINNYVAISPPSLLPSSGGSGGSFSLPDNWLEDYPALQTNPNIEINSVPVPTETIPPDLAGKMVAISQKGFDLFNCFGLAAPLIAITVFGIVYKRFID